MLAIRGIKNRKLGELKDNLDRHNVLPPKLMDHRSFYNFCKIGNIPFNNVLYDLGAGVIAISLSTF